MSTKERQPGNQIHELHLKNVDDLVIPKNLFKERTFLLLMLFIWVFVQSVTLLKNVHIYRLYQEPYHLIDLFAPRLCSLFVGLILLAGTWYLARHLIKHGYSVKSSIVFHLVVGIGLSFLSFALVHFMMLYFPLVKLPDSRSLVKFYLMEIDRQVLIYLFFAGFTYAYFFIVSYHQKKTAQLLLLNALGYERIHTLIKEMDPHLLGNYLSGIRYLYHHDQERASRMIDALASWTDKHLDQNEVWVSLDRELEFTEAYYALEKIRYGEKLHLRIHCNADQLNLYVPSKIIQPLVENAIKHGWRKNQELIIEVRIAVENGEINIQVINNGIPVGTQLSTPHRHIGLTNLHKRLAILFDSQYTLKLNNEAISHTVNCSLTIPIQQTPTLKQVG